MARRDKDLRPLEPWRQPITAAGRAVVADAVAAIERAEHRQRQRREADHTTFLEAVAAIVADVAHLHLAASSDSPSRIVVARSKRTLGHAARRYRTPAHTTRLPAILDALNDTGFIRQVIGDSSKFVRVFTDEFGEMRERMPTTIAAGPALIDAIERHGVGFGDFGVVDTGELIVLRSGRADYWSQSETLDYDDTEQTLRWRRELAAVNAWLAAADLAVLDAPHIDTSARQMRRIFGQGRFDCGGRLAGNAFWLSLRRDLRNRQLRIDGEPVAVIDFTSMFPRLCFALVRAPQPTDDIYDIPGIGPEHRAAMKKLIAARLFDNGPRRSWPKRSAREIAEDVQPYPAMPAGTALELIEARHPELAAHFGRGIGHHLMFVESEVILATLRRAMRADLWALPLHDACICPASRAEEMAGLMQEATKEVIGTEMPVGISKEEQDT